MIGFDEEQFEYKDNDNETEDAVHNTTTIHPNADSIANVRRCQLHNRIQQNDAYNVIVARR